jgi:hypothetical protein
MIPKQAVKTPVPRWLWIVASLAIAAGLAVATRIVLREREERKAYHSDNWQRATCEKGPLFAFGPVNCGIGDIGRGSTASLRCHPDFFHEGWIKGLGDGSIEKIEVPGMPGLKYFKSRSLAGNDSNQLVFVWGEANNPRFVSCNQISLQENGISRGSYCQAVYQLKNGVVVTHNFHGDQSLPSIVHAVDGCFIPLLNEPFKNAAPYWERRGSRW